MSGVSAYLTLVRSQSLVIVALASASSDLAARVIEGALRALVPARFPRPSLRRDEPPWSRKLHRKLAGIWHGAIAKDKGPLTLTLVVERDGTMKAAMESRRLAPLHGTAFRKDELQGYMVGGLGTDDLEGSAACVAAVAQAPGQRLQASATALGGQPARFPLALTHWVDLERRNRVEPASARSVR